MLNPSRLTFRAVRRCSPTLMWAGLLASLLSGCASPADSVRVPTMPMQQAWTVRLPHQAAVIPTVRHHALVYPAWIGHKPIPVVTAPVIRMAYLYPRTGQEGVLHYGEWIGIAVHGYRWVLPDGTQTPLRGAHRSADQGPGA